MNTKNNFVTGITDLIVLFLLDHGDKYVYEIVQTIEHFSGGLLKLPQNTIYTATYKLENEEMISEYSVLVGRKRTRVYYHIEDKGKEYLSGLLAEYNSVTQGILKILSHPFQEGDNDNENQESN